MTERHLPDWRDGNRFELLENGEEFFPRVFEAIRSAHREVLVETFILFDDKVGQQLREELIAAASRGVQVDLTVDGYGSPDLSVEFVSGMTAAGVRFHVFDPKPKLLGLRTNVFRRLHRKLVVVDGQLAFVGGINFSVEHLWEYGPAAKQDYAVAVVGPVVADIHRFAVDAIGERTASRRRRAKAPAGVRQGADVGPGRATFVTRDNREHHTDIEQHYLFAIRSARRRVWIANAYFFPGYRLLRELRRAARRGVEVALILQGEPDMPIAKNAARTLYDGLLRDGVRIYEYCQRPLHGKVAVVDDEWATVGSSNLDPLSLSLNLEANLVIRDAAFNAELAGRLQRLIDHHCQLISVHDPAFEVKRWHQWAGFLVYHFLRRFPAWSGWLPAHKPKLELVTPPPHQPPADPPVRNAHQQPATKGAGYLP
ncbi:cardiolipin synthase ClsB [Caldimonas brevitalea]|uniref:Cardiolipin synthase B n=1 Tax=Caldimonas brevitalea TaxID=413882 RepID=A0A0G3BFS3_9BURK|nr:cardiolipin synthase ClsB [Caldimonas brevitalea]AKJ28197.1 putative cardiolipin synthase [Caldimonas brevitalea]